MSVHSTTVSAQVVRTQASDAAGACSPLTVRESVPASSGISGPRLQGEVCGLPVPDVASCRPPLVVKSVSDASCVRFFSSVDAMIDPSRLSSPVGPGRGRDAGRWLATGILASVPRARRRRARRRSQSCAKTRKTRAVLRTVLDAIAATEKQTLPRIHLFPTAPARQWHGKVRRDLARREPRQILDEVQPGVELGPPRVEEIGNQTGAGLRLVLP